MSHVLALRADVPKDEGFKSKFCAWVAKEFDGFIVAFEIADGNPHVHCILDGQKTEKAVRSSFTRTFPECVGNKAYSLKECNDDHDAYIRYICKGDSETSPPDIWAKCGLLYSADVIEAAHKKFYVNRAAVLEDNKKKAAVEKLSAVQLVEKECKRMGIKGFDREGIARVYLKLWRDARKPINVFAGRAVVNTVSLVLDGASDDDLVRKLSEI